MKLTDLVKEAAPGRVQRLVAFLFVVLSALLIGHLAAAGLHAEQLVSALIAVAGATVTLVIMGAVLMLPPAQRWILTGKMTKDGRR
jgi:hypothetical protein